MRRAVTAGGWATPTATIKRETLNMDGGPSTVEIINMKVGDRCEGCHGRGQIAVAGGPPKPSDIN